MVVAVPEEATVVDDAGTVGGRALADLRHSGGEASNTIRLGQVVPALHHGIGWFRTYHLLCSCKVFVVVVELCSEVGERCV